MSDKIKKLLPEIIFLAAIFLFIYTWAAVQPFNVSPDEHMRYDIVQYLLDHGKLPHGGDPEIRDPNWGISYAFNPILAYMYMAVFAKIVSCFTDQFETIVLAARFGNVLLGVGTAWLTLKLGDHFFEKWRKWLFAALVMFLPGTVFIFSYVNTDGLAIFATVWILLFWARSMKQGWTWKNCIGLASGLGLCALSYYNAYGVILASVFYFILDVLCFREKKWDFKFLFSRGFAIAGIALLIAGWWFVRSYIIYDGDILGMTTSSMYSEMYAIEELKPSNRFRLSDTEMSLPGMFFFVPGQWLHNWTMTVAVSFVGTFGYMTVFMPFWLTRCYFIVFILGVIGIVMKLGQTFLIRKREYLVVRKEINGEPVKIKMIQKKKELSKDALFHWCLVLTAVIPLVLLIYYAYCSDFQAQGRYLLPGLMALMYFVTRGIDNLLERFIKKEKIRDYICMVLIILLIVAAVFTYVTVFKPSCVIG